MELEIPGYKFKRVIGKGGMARVYLAEQTIFGRDVALKVMSKSLSEDATFGKRFFREAQIVAKLVHPNIVTVHDVGVHKGYYYLSMELLDGQDLKVRRKNLTITQKITALRDIAKALDYAGAKGYVHRDIKPENIMFQQADGRAVLTDFGIARAAQTDVAMTQTGVAIGTPHYMSPEQAKGKPVDGRSDIYSLGIVFYLLMVGRVPYDAESAVAIGIKHITEPVPLLPAGYEGLQGILDRMMAKQVDRRYQSAAMLIDDLDSIDLGRLIEAVEYAATHHSNEHENATLEADNNQSEIDTERFTVTQEAVRDLPRQRFFLPWIMSFLLVGSGVLSAVYILRPKPLEPYIKHAEKISKTVFEYGQGYFQQVLSKFKGVSDIDSSSTSTEEQKEESSVAQGYADKATQGGSLQNSAATGNTFNDTADDSKGRESENPQTLVSSGALQKKRSESLTGTAESSAPLTTNSATNSATNKPTLLAPDNTSTRTDPESLKPRVASTGDAVSSSENLVLLKYRKQLRESKVAYANDVSLLADYVDAHRDLLANFPDDEETLTSLKNLQSDLKQTLIGDARNGKITSARKQLTQFRYLFSKLPADSFSAIEKDLNDAIKTRSLLRKAQRYLSANTLTRPEGANALSTFRQVLTLDDTNKTAIDGLNLIAKKMTNFAEINFKNGQIVLALQQVETVLSIAPDNKQAKSLQRELQNTKVSDKAISNLLNNAKDAISRGDLFEPSMSNAYDYYRSVLNIDANNFAAQQGITNLTSHLSDKVWTLLNNEEYINARLNLRRPLELMPNDPSIQSLSRSVEMLIEEKKSSRS